VSEQPVKREQDSTCRGEKPPDESAQPDGDIKAGGQPESANSARTGVHIILQVRFHSNRLPGKLMLPLKGRSVFHHVLARLLACREPEKVIVATCARTVPFIERTCLYHRVDVVTGSEQDVLGRYAKSVREHGTETVVRATGDNPLVCISYLDRAVRLHLEKKPDLTVFPRLPYGTGVEVISAAALLEAEAAAGEPEEREHITRHLYLNPHRFSVLSLDPEPLFFRPGLRLTVDTVDDYLRMRRIYQSLYAGVPIPLENVIRLLDRDEPLDRKKAGR
jgi:spore coat polysaccharide biosynthesis protein SpsF